MSDEAPQAAGRITAPLIGEAVIALENTARTLGLSKTDTVNRALQAYAFLVTLQETGGAVYVRQPGEDGLHRLSLLQAPGGAV